MHLYLLEETYKSTSQNTRPLQRLPVRLSPSQTLYLLLVPPADCHFSPQKTDELKLFAQGSAEVPAHCMQYRHPSNLMKERSRSKLYKAHLWTRGKHRAHSNSCSCTNYVCEWCVWLSTARQTASVSFLRRTGPVFYPRLFALSAYKHMLVTKSLCVGSLAGIKALVDISAKRHHFC